MPLFRIQKLRNMTNLLTGLIIKPVSEQQLTLTGDRPTWANSQVMQKHW